MSLQNMHFKKAYYEITNVCNASCSFCPKTERAQHFVTDDEFLLVLEKLKGKIDYLYFHLMGEPLIHPHIAYFAEKARLFGFKVMITTNGILAGARGISLISEGNVNKISISLHSYEANSFGSPLCQYLDDCISLAEKCAEVGTVCALRLWNKGHLDELNCEIIKALKKHFTDEWLEQRTGYKLKEYVFLEFGEHFEWPDANSNSASCELFCHGLRNQIGILSDGTVVPCCLDSEGRISLGNIYGQTLEELLSSERAKAIYDGFSAHRPVEALCKSCGYAKRFK